MYLIIYLQSDQAKVHSFSESHFEFNLSMYSFVSIWSHCAHLSTTENGQLNLKAIDRERKLAKYVKAAQPTLNYFSFDVCNSTESLLHVLVDLSLSSRFYFPSMQNHHGNRDTIRDEGEHQTYEHNSTSNQASSPKVQRNMNIVALFGYVTPDQSKLIKEILGYMDVPRICFPFLCDDRIPTKNITDSSYRLLGLLDHFQWRNVKMLSGTQCI